MPREPGRLKTARPFSLAVLPKNEREVPPSVAQSIIIKFLTNEGVKPTEIRDRVRAQFGENAHYTPQSKKRPVSSGESKGEARTIKSQNSLVSREGDVNGFLGLLRSFPP